MDAERKGTTALKAVYISIAQICHYKPATWKIWKGKRMSQLKMTVTLMEDVFGDSCDCDYNSDDSFEL